MPNRILREGINSSPRVNRLSLGAEVLYRRLMSVADDYGRFYASPATVRGACFPTASDKACEQDVINWLAECQQIASNDVSALLTIYEVAGCRYLQINDFKQQTRTKSKFPEPASGLISDCEQNASTSRSRSRISESESYSESAAEKTSVASKPPPTSQELKDQIKTIAQLKSMSDPEGDRRKICKQLLMAYPEAGGLPGEPDALIVTKCLDLAHDSPESLGTALRSMFLANKKPATSWAWFPKVLEQYLEPRA